MARIDALYLEVRVGHELLFGTDQKSLVVLFWFSPDLSVSVVINVDVNCIGSAADRTVFNVRLT